MRYIVLFIFAYVMWILLTYAVDWQHLLTGALVSLFITIIFGKSAFVGKVKFFDLRRWFWFIVYIFVFVWECIKANIDVAYRVIHPLMPIKPGIVKVKTNLKSDIAKTWLANSITMTPGTLSVDIDGEYLYVHWMYVRDESLEGATEKIVGRFEKLLMRIFE